jgi:YgiT-type zinc finger domain-containing protein
LDIGLRKEKTQMKCVICKHGETKTGTATVTLERDAATVVFKSVPAEVCENCAEEYVDDKTAAELLEMFEQSLKAGVMVDVRTYAA